MERRSNCSRDFHLHEVQGSVQSASCGCSSHNHRFATVSCEPVELNCGDHAHNVTFRTDSCDGHYHEFCGRTTDAVELCGSHVHYLEGATTEQAGHRHCFKVATHIEEPISD